MQGWLPPRPRVRPVTDLMRSETKHHLGFLWPVVGLAAVGFASWLLYKELRGLSAADVWEGLWAISHTRYLAAVAATFAAYVALTWYDRIALLHLGRKMSWLFTSATSFTAYALSHNIGMSVIPGAMVRYRAYSSKGLSIPEVAVLVAFCSFTFALGTTLLGGLVLTIAPDVVRHFGLPLWVGQMTGLGMLGLVGLYVAGSLLHLPPLMLGNFRVVYPRPAIMLRQVIAGPLELVGRHKHHLFCSAGRGKSGICRRTRNIPRLVLGGAAVACSGRVRRPGTRLSQSLARCPARPVDRCPHRLPGALPGPASGHRHRARHLLRA